MKLLWLNSLFWISPFVAAATTAPLAVDGVVTPPSCSISLSAGTSVSLGAIASGTLNRTARTELAQVPAGTLDVVCAGPTLVGINAVDNVHASTYFPGSSDAKYFGLGLDASGNPVGNYRIYMDHPVVDNATGYMTMSSNSGSTWFAISGANDATLIRGSLTTLSSWNNTSTGAPPTALTTVSTPVILLPSIAPSNTLNTTVEIDLNGSATLQLVYL